VIEDASKKRLREGMLGGRASGGGERGGDVSGVEEQERSAKSPSKLRKHTDRLGVWEKRRETKSISPLRGEPIKESDMRERVIRGEKEAGFLGLMVERELFFCTKVNISSRGRLRLRSGITPVLSGGTTQLNLVVALFGVFWLFSDEMGVWG